MILGGAAKCCRVGHLPRHVGEERHLARALDRDRNLTLMAPARARDAAVADLALLRDVAPELVDVLVVDLVDFVLAEEAGFPPDRSGRRTLPAARLPVGLLSHSVLPRTGCRRRPRLRRSLRPPGRSRRRERTWSRRRPGRGCRGTAPCRRSPRRPGAWSRP